MKRYRKKDLLQIVSTLVQVNDSVAKAVSSTVLFEAEEEFAKCQESAIDLGNYLETLDDMDYTPLVSILEDYCENVYQMGINIQDENLCRKLTKKIRKQLLQLQNAITYDMPPDKKEVVFLPYKAAMWDSLESVWKAAQEDESCDAYVIPIPYFDKNPDGSFREEHYEGDLYPEDVPITRYDTYDFEERRPDIIYIHNAYDNWNLVTSVHPNFFSGNLKKYTEKLVYIPYFVLDEVSPDNEQAVESIKHFCFLPGIINADKVIVQSEDMKKIYINEYLKAAREHGLQGKHLDRTYLEQKFLGLGSPKYDRIFATKREDLEIPQEWLSVIEKPDGSWKKIILYNTVIGTLLAHDEKWVDKIENALNIFRENQDEVVLLWRPHPLIESTMKSMRPAVLEKYMMLKNNYVSEGWGIYDDTADVDRAVVLSDAYYGDYSSVVQLYRQTGKPIMIQNVEIIT
ncbi:MAG: CDP-glycerol glycerophosphotransferase family protein [Lachnospiraceae bacterium]|nr:CDP-glycerol glycerophosphotransferase family protein [Lachnospiraceae bacterium]